MCQLAKKKKKEVFWHSASKAKLEQTREGWGRRERERKVSTREGKVQGKKVEEENGECTCNLTVMKGTPRKECNKTGVK